MFYKIIDQYKSKKENKSSNSYKKKIEDKSNIESQNNDISEKVNMSKKVIKKDKTDDRTKVNEKKNIKKKNLNSIDNRYKNIIKKYKNTEFDYYYPTIDILSHFKYCSPSANFVYFKCIYRRYKCPGIIKKNIITNEITVTTPCDNKINHNSLMIKEFYKFYEKGNFKELHMESIKYKNIL